MRYAINILYLILGHPSNQVETSKAKNNIMTSSETKEMLVSQRWYICIINFKLDLCRDSKIEQEDNTKKR